MLKDLLKKKLTKKELALVPSSFDIIGNRDKAVAIIDVPPELKKKQKLIATALMRQHKNVKTVLAKMSPRKGKYRIMELKIIKGKKDTEVMHIESGCRFLLDPKKVYFSPREGSERLRIAELANEKETIAVFFAGIGPFAIIIAKKAKPKKVIGIDINPDAVEYFKENIRLNKLENTEAILGDVKKEAEKFYGLCDRVLMPLPETSSEYLEEAIKCLKKNGICHFYCFAEEDKIKENKKTVLVAAKKLKRKIKFLEVTKVLPYGPRIWKTRIDFIVM